MKLDTLDDNVEVLDATPEQVRDWLDNAEGDWADELENKLDQAQGDVFSKVKSVRYVIIKVTSES